MRNTTESTPRPQRPVSVHRWKWMIAAALVILGLAWFAEPSRGDDGDVGTVPIPTSTSEPTPVPTVTPTSRPPKPPTNTPPPPPTDTPSAPTNTPAPGQTPTETPAPTDTPTATPTEAPTEELTPTPEPQFALDLIMSAPPLALQGDEVVIRFMVQNPGPEEATNVVLRDRLPGGLTLVSAEAEGGQVTTTQEGDGTVVRINWARVAPGGVLNATLAVQVAEDLPNGVVIDNLAVVYGDNARADTDGLSIGLPPAILPLFR